MSGRSSIWPAIAMVALLAGACGKQSAHPESLGAALQEATAHAEKPAVEIDGRPVDVAEFEAFWSDRPDLGRDEAIASFVEQEQLVGPALERNVAERPEVAVARKRAMVHRLLEETVEKDVTEESLDSKRLDEVEQTIRQESGHPPGIRASHILVAVPRDPGSGKVLASDDDYDRARVVLEQIREELPDRPLPLDLLQAKRAFAERVEEPLEVQMNAHMRFPAVETRGTLPETWLNVVGAFREPAVEMARAGDFDRLSEPVRSPFGWHLILVHEVLPGEEPEPEAVRAAATAKLLEIRRSQDVAERYKTWRAKAAMQQFPQVIEQAGEIE